jgi:hypothetical protein
MDMKLPVSLIPALATLLSTASAQSADLPANANFQSIELHGGGIVTLRHGPVRRVTFAEGSALRPLREEDGRLIIDRCQSDCRGRHRVKLEVETPTIARIAVNDGGIIQLEGAFPAQAALAVAVANGGVVDARALESGRITAGVSSGGRIMVRSRGELDATISDGGVVTYWGQPRVRSSIRRGGAVGPGDPDDLTRPMAPPETPPPPVPPVPNILKR